MLDLAALSQNQPTKLRDYQRECIDKVRSCFRRGDESALVVMATGSGKTVVFSRLIEEVITSAIEKKLSMRVFVLVNKIALIEQIERECYKFLRPKAVGQICGSRQEYSEGEAVTIGMVQSVAQVKELGIYDLVIIDECHRVVERDGSQWVRVLERLKKNNPRLRVLGVTATPFTSMGKIYGEGRMFREIAFEKNITELTRDGHLVRARLCSPDEAASWDVSQLREAGQDYSDVELARLFDNQAKAEAQVNSALAKSMGRKKCVWMCINIEHACFVKQLIGDSAAVVHSLQSQYTRDIELDRFRNDDQCRHMVNVGILTEGFDMPEIDCVVLLRPTRSPVLYVQAVGRGLRIARGKKDCLVLDYGKVVETLGPLDRPSLPEQRSRPKNPVDAVNYRIVRCQGCGEFYFPMKTAGESHCQSCGLVEDRSRQISLKKTQMTPAAEANLYSETFENWHRVLRVEFHLEEHQLITRYYLQDGYEGQEIVFDQRHALPAQRGYGMDIYDMGKTRSVKSHLTHFGVKTASLDRMISECRLYTTAPQFVLIDWKKKALVESKTFKKTNLVPRSELGRHILPQSSKPG